MGRFEAAEKAPHDYCVARLQAQDHRKAVKATGCCSRNSQLLATGGNDGGVVAAGRDIAGWESFSSGKQEKARIASSHLVPFLIGLSIPTLDVPAVLDGEKPSFWKRVLKSDRNSIDSARSEVGSSSPSCRLAGRCYAPASAVCSFEGSWIACVCARSEWRTDWGSKTQGRPGKKSPQRPNILPVWRQSFGQRRWTAVSRWCSHWPTFSLIDFPNSIGSFGCDELKAEFAFSATTM